MAKIDVAQFLGKPKEYTICGNPVLIEPLKGKDMDLIFGMKEGHEAEGVRRLIMSTFGLSPEEYDQLPAQFINEASMAILDVNGLRAEGKRTS